MVAIYKFTHHLNKGKWKNKAKASGMGKDNKQKKKQNWKVNEQGTKVFCKLASKCDAVICCRASPAQKEELVQIIGKSLGKRTLAIGDGSNDVRSSLLSFWNFLFITVTLRFNN